MAPEMPSSLSACFKDFLKELHIFGKILVIVRPLDYALVASEKAGRLRLDVFADRDALKLQQHLLSLLGEHVVKKEPRRVRIRRLGADH